MVKIEIAHDTLARRIFDKVSAEDKMRRRVVLFLQDRQQYYLQTRRLLDRNDLHYVEPYLESIKGDLSEEVLKFVQRSQARRTRQKAYLVLFVLVAMAILGFGAVYENSNKNRIAAINVELEGKTREVEHAKDSLANLIKKNEELFQSNKINLDSFLKAQKQRDEAVRALRAEQQRLVETNQKLEKKTRELEQAYKKLEELNKKIQEESRKQLADAKQDKMNSVRVGDLTQKAYEAYNRGQKEQAFQYAADAWKLDKNNVIAVDILRRIHRDLNKAPNWDTPPLNIIREHSKRFNYKM